MPLAAVSMIAGVAICSGAQAQSYSNIGQFVAFPGSNRGHNVSVLQRDRPDYDALGMRAGVFVLFPKVNFTPTHTDNVFATETNEKSDTYLDFQPSVAVSSDWSRNSLDMNAGLNSRRFTDYSSQNYNNWNVDASGRLDVGSDSFVSGGVERKRDHITREQISFPANAANPIATDTTDGFLRGVFQANRIRLLGNVVVAKLEFKDVANINGGNINNADRNFDTVATTLRGDYAISPDTALFAEVKRTGYNYDAPTITGAKRDSTQTEALLGASFDLTQLVRGEIGVGYLRREYDDPSFKKISGTALRGTLEYFPTPLATVTFNVRSSVEDSILATAGGYLSNFGSGRVDYELLRNVLLFGQFSYEKDDFRGADRTDKVKEAAIGGTYLLNRSVGVSAGYTYRDRESTGALRGPSFNLNKFSVTLTLRR
jgi:hypothetical protein